ncbi:hypothetical protein [Methylomonas methanica]|uniref:DNA-binding protein n=1 Tax=Methylomonas methanica (strain DSM 25384 / MC09) TaxID=857087 RepID=F9ZV44_METMM|nr:hypothetical protein [Methylomonas methanica]AEF99477.1 hypothetical protein Metme_1041 [Methylomonas methanica MC09]
MEQAPESTLQLFTPIMTKDRFAEISGVPVGVLQGWVDRNYVPTLVIGKHKVINMVQLQQICLEQLPR